MANKYVRQGATGTGSGDNWTDAYTDLPASLTRENTYYIADGTYSAGYHFDDTEDGTKIITVKKATAADHGTETGWSSTYGDGQATFPGEFIFYRDYYVIDGVTRNENNWKDSAAYGFKVTGGISAHRDNFPPGGDNITIQYVCLGTGTITEFDPDNNIASLYLTSYGTPFTGWTLSHCFSHNGGFISLNGVDGVIIEYNHIEQGFGKQAIRGQVLAKNVIIRHNTFIDATQINPNDPTSGITGEICFWDGSDFDNVEIYGNTFSNSKLGARNCLIVIGGDGITWVGSPGHNSKVYNNTFAGIADGGSAGGIILNGNNTEAINNLFYDSAETAVNADTASNNVTSSSDPFIDFNSKDFRIISSTGGTYPRNAGTSISGSNYSLDRLGNTRGNDGAWDVGAYEFEGGNVTNRSSIIGKARISGNFSSSVTINGTAKIAGEANYTQVQQGKANIQHLRMHKRFPSGDVTPGNWTTAPLYEKIDEFIPNDSDVIASSQKPSNDYCEFSLPPMNAPNNKSSHAVKYRIRKVLNTHSLSFKVGLYEGDTLIAEHTHDNVPTDWIDGMMILTSAQASSITNYSNLKLRFTANTM